MKTRLPACEVSTWLRSVPDGARYDLTGRRGPEVPPAVGELDHDGAHASAVAELVDRVAVRYGVDPQWVVPTLGAGQALVQALVAIVRPGEHVVVERPTGERLRRVPEVLGARVSRLERIYDEDWAVLPERVAKLLTPHTRAVILGNLHEPTGVPLPAKTVAEVAGLAERVGAVVVVDEERLDLALDPAGGPACRSACLAADNVISLGSVACGVGTPAIGAGWLATRHAAASAAIRAAADYLHGEIPTLTARIAARIVGSTADPLEPTRRATAAARKVVDRWIAAERRVGWVAPAPGIAGLVRLPELMQDDTFVAHLRERYDTQVMPGTLFEAPGFVRVGLLADPSALEQGLANFSAALDDLG